MLRVGDRDGAKHHRVDEREDGGIGADAERDRDDDDGGEDGRFANAAQGEAQILREMIEPRGDPNSARVFHHPGNVAEFAHGGVAGFFGRHSAGDVVLGFDVDVILDVGFETGEHALAIAIGHRSHHDLFSCLAGRRMRAMAPANLSHLRVSSASWRRPWGVNE